MILNNFYLGQHSKLSIGYSKPSINQQVSSETAVSAICTQNHRKLYIFSFSPLTDKLLFDDATRLCREEFSAKKNIARKKVNNYG